MPVCRAVQSYAETHAKLRDLVDKLAPFQKYDDSALVKNVAGTIACYQRELSHILDSDVEFFR